MSDTQAFHDLVPLPNYKFAVIDYLMGDNSISVKGPYRFLASTTDEAIIDELMNRVKPQLCWPDSTSKPEPTYYTSIDSFIGVRISDPQEDISHVRFWTKYPASILPADKVADVAEYIPTLTATEVPTEGITPKQVTAQIRSVLKAMAKGGE